MLAEKLHKAYDTNQKPKILVIGDLMIDHYIFGSANRLSPEAPVPIVNVSKESKIIGGAANVASNLVDLGAKVYLAGIVGDDQAGEEMKVLLTEKSIDTSLILSDKSRKTTIKTRIIAGTHQIVRIDKEDIHDISIPLEDLFLEQISSQIAEVNMVILSDYNKGVLTHSLSQKIISLCEKLQVKVIVDPKGLDYSKYRGAYIIKPNRKELAEAAKMERINTEDTLVQAAQVILNITNASHLVVTLSEAGIAIIDQGNCQIIPVVATEVYDVTGAGDTVIATLAYCLSFGFTIEESAVIANYAASIVIKHIGSATTSIPEIITSLKSNV